MSRYIQDPNDSTKQVAGALPEETVTVPVQLTS